jgi:hypothetical protein
MSQKECIERTSEFQVPRVNISELKRVLYLKLDDEIYADISISSTNKFYTMHSFYDVLLQNVFISYNLFILSTLI